MTTSTSAHGITEIIVEDGAADGIHWLDIYLNGKTYEGNTRLTVHGMSILDLVNACERALHKDNESDKAALIKASDEGYVI